MEHKPENKTVAEVTEVAEEMSTAHNGLTAGYDDDYARAPVPVEKRRSWVRTGLVYMGSCISLSAFMLGGTLASGLTMNGAIVATLIGTLILAVMTVMCARVTLHNHLSTSMISRFTFGNKGAGLVSIMYALCAWGWFGVQVGLFGDTIGAMFTMITGNEMTGLVIKIVMAIGGIAMTTTAIFGYKSIEILSIIAIPLIGILMFASLFMVLRGHDLSALNSLGMITSPISMGMGISIVIASYAAGAVGCPDILRYAKSLKEVMYGVGFGLVGGYSITVLIAAVCSKVTGEANIVNVMITLGWGMFAMLVLILAQWTTNDNNIYSASLGFSIVFTKVPKYKLAIATGVVGTIFALLGISGRLIPFFSILGIFTPPIGGCYLADFLLNKYYYNFDNLKNVPAVRAETMIAYFAAAAIGFLVTEGPTGLGLFRLTTVPAVDTFLVAGILQVVLVLVMRKNFRNINRPNTI